MITLLCVGMLSLLFFLKNMTTESPLNLLLKEAEGLGWERGDGRASNSKGQALCTLTRGHQLVEVDTKNAVVWMKSPSHDSYFKDFREVQRWLLLTEPFRNI